MSIECSKTSATWTDSGALLPAAGADHYMIREACLPEWIGISEDRIIYNMKAKMERTVLLDNGAVMGGSVVWLNAVRSCECSYLVNGTTIIRCCRRCRWTKVCRFHDPADVSCLQADLEFNLVQRWTSHTRAAKDDLAGLDIMHCAAAIFLDVPPVDSDGHRAYKRNPGH